MTKSASSFDDLHNPGARNVSSVSSSLSALTPSFLSLCFLALFSAVLLGCRPQCSRVLPPPIVDRVSGKTFIAIPAPHFISTQISGNDSVQTNFVYVETRTPSLNRMFTPERSGVLCSKQPVDNWMVRNPSELNLSFIKLNFC